MRDWNHLGLRSMAHRLPCQAIEQMIALSGQTLLKSFVVFSGIEDVTPTPIADMVPINHSAQWRQRQAIQQAALQLGLTEVVPFPLHAPDDSSQPVILNPITPELTVLRSSAIQSLIATAQFNATRHHAPCRLFTIGPVWQSDGTEQLHFAAYVAGLHHHEPHLPAHNRSVDFFSL